MSEAELRVTGQTADPDHLEVHSDGRVHAHISSFRLYVVIFFSLICLTLLTVAASDIPLGKMNLVVAVVIASMKASLVVLFFMHIKYDNKFNAIIIIVAILFIGVFFAYTMNDTNRRGEIDLEQGVKVLPSTGVEAPGGRPVPTAMPTAQAAGKGPAEPSGMSTTPPPHER